MTVKGIGLNAVTPHCATTASRSGPSTLELRLFGDDNGEQGNKRIRILCAERCLWRVFGACTDVVELSWRSHGLSRSIGSLVLVHDRIVPHRLFRTVQCWRRTVESASVLPEPQPFAVCPVQLPSWVGKQWNVRPQARHNCGLPVHARPSLLSSALLLSDLYVHAHVRVKSRRLYYPSVPSVNVSIGRACPLETQRRGAFTAPDAPASVSPSADDIDAMGQPNHWRRSSAGGSDWPVFDYNITTSQRIG